MKNKIEVSEVLQKLSTVGIRSILSEYDHVQMSTIRSRDDCEQVAQHNINDGLIDEIEFMIALSGE